MSQILKTDKFLFLITVLFLTVLLSACGNQTGNTGDNAETEVKAFGIDFMQGLSLHNPAQIVCGQTSAWAVTAWKDDFIYQLEYETDTAGIKEIEWQQGEGETLLGVAEQGGRLYSVVQIKGDDSIEIRRRSSGGQWNVVCAIDAKDAKWEWYTVGGGFFVDGSENAYLVSEDTVTRFGAEGQQTCEYELAGKACFFRENTENGVECAALGAKGITLYELKEDGAEEKWTLDVSARQLCGIQSSDEEILCLATEEKLLFIDRESGSLLAQSDLVMTGVPSVMAGVYDGNTADKETLRLYGVDGGSAGNLFCCLLSGREPSAEQRTELVYGTMRNINGGTADCIKAAIMKFNQENENYYIAIRNYYGDWEHQRLNADMAGGNAPDILDLSLTDYYEAYARGGYLENLSPYLEQSEYQDDIMWNVLNTYDVDGGLYLLAPQFSLGGLLIHPEYEDYVEEWNMGAFLDLVEINQWEKDPLGNGGNRESLLYYLLAGCQDEFIDRGDKTAAFETEEFVKLLELCREYGECDQPDQEGWTYEEHQWNTLCSRINIWQLSFYLMNTDIYGREYQIYGYPISSGQVYKIETCPDCCGIYAGSGHKEGAWEFVESLLGEANQNSLSMQMNAGLPIRSSLLKQAEEEAKKQDMRVGGSTAWITDNEIAIIEDIIYHGEFVRGLLDADIWNVVQEEAASYFAGDKGAEEVAEIIQNRVQLMLDE